MAKSAKRKSDDAVSTAADRPSKLPNRSAQVGDTDIARRAYALYLARNRAHGHDVDDWLQAERDLRAEYLEMPGLRLKPEQVQRVWDVERTMCQRVLDSLVDAKFCARGRTDTTHA